MPAGLTPPVRSQPGRNEMKPNVGPVMPGFALLGPIYMHLRRHVT